MIRRVLVSLAVLVLFPVAAWPAGGVRRFLLVTAANDGGRDRPPLHYALSDADRFARVIGELGGVSPDDAIVLKQPRLGELEDALDQLKTRVSRARATADTGRTELLFYYSGHADDKGLLLGEDRYSYRSLRDRLDDVPADVRIAVLDACASGAITRLKGGRRRLPFLVDESAEMRGHAFLTSSAETEAAQESDRIRASYFTHYLVSGLRGAADVSGEGKVTLNEAYQFAFNETLGGTVETRGGAQHPSYDINLAGTGEVVMTDLRQTQATLVLGEAIDGRFFVRNAKQELVVELYKPYGRRVELGVEPGSYEVHLEREAAAFLARPKLDEGAQVVLEAAQFTPTTPQPTRARGGMAPPRYAVADRNRIDLRLGARMLTGGSRSGTPSVGVRTTDLVVGGQYTRFVSEKLAFTLSVDELAAEVGTDVSSQGVFSGSVSVVSFPIGVQWNPLRSESRSSALKPFLSAALGPVIGSSVGSFVGTAEGSFSGTQTLGAIGGYLGGGVDIVLSRHFSIGLGAGYSWMADFSEPVGARDNYSGFDVRLSIGWLFGKGSAPRE